MTITINNVACCITKRICRALGRSNSLWEKY